MREIKFRAWDDGKMIYEKDIWHLSLEDNDVYRLAKFFCNVRNDSKIMQYTGLKDKNGKEIYEGDKIKFYYWSTYEQRSFPEYVDFRETEMKEGVGVVYWNETELSWYVRPIEGTTVYHRSERPMQLDEMPLVYAGLTMESISDWVGEYDASEEDLKQYTGRDGIEVIGNIYQTPELLTNPPLPKE